MKHLGDYHIPICCHPCLKIKFPLIPINAVRKTRSLPPQGCYRCGEANHLVKDCPHCLDVRRLTAEQREELIEDLMALKDAVEEEEVCSALEEDFA